MRARLSKAEIYQLRTGALKAHSTHMKNTNAKMTRLNNKHDAQRQKVGAVYRQVPWQAVNIHAR